MKYYILTFGCQMNVSDSEKIAALLQKQGHEPVKADSPAKALPRADLIVINACSVRQAAIDRVYGQINNFPGKKIIIAGCLLDFDKKRLAQNKNIAFWSPDEYFELPPICRNKFSAYVPIMTGCNNFCSYCVVPYTRGREKSRQAVKIIKEVKSLIKKKCKEIILLGQNVNSYKSRISTNTGTNFREYKIRDIRGQISANSRDINFAKLISIINDIPGDFHLSFLTSHPKDMTDELIKTMARCEKLTKEIHLPIQSGDNIILHKMNRHYTVTHYKNLIKKIRKAIPSIKISTDIIVGFPGETKKQFQNTAKLAKVVKFDKAYIAKYSPRPGTAAAKLKDDVPALEKTRRWRLLDTLINKFQH